MFAEEVSQLEYFLPILALIIATTGLVYLWRSKIIYIRAVSSLHSIDERVVVRFYVVNDSERPITIKSIRLPILINDNALRLEVSGVMKVMRVIDDLTGREPSSCYVSDRAIKYNVADSNMTLGASQPMEAELDLDEMFDQFLKANETFGLRFYFLAMIMFMKFEVVLTTGKSYKFKLHRDISHFLKVKYGSDGRFFRN